MRLIIYSLALLFCLFPYTQILDLDSYTQPYAFLLSIIASGAAFARLRAYFPARDAIALIALAFTGLMGFLISSGTNPTFSELRYLLIYVSPVVFAFASFGIAIEYPRAADRIIVFATLTWMAVGIIQTVIDPSFASQFVGRFSAAAEVVVESGRGTLGLAPEPTHFGFHMIILAAALVLMGGRNWLSLACLVTALIIARSSSAALALGLGALIYLVIFGGRARWLLLLVVPFYFMIGLIVEAHMLPQNLRIVQLMTDFYQDPLYPVLSDASANQRLGGIYVGAKQIIVQGFMPAGMSEETWLDLIGPIMAANPWLIMLSEAGVPSGILIVGFQLGLFGLIPLIFILYRMLSGLRSHYETFLLCTMVFVFFSQYMISTPGFGVIYGMVIARRLYAARAAENSNRAAIPTRRLIAAT
ncbi:hypothetical protein [Sphingopyxis sp.]|uniref:hypothetical protein n=1 Tax=Sphingopyxis sp. TaxID=1908224 RepID=UPI002B49E2D5|nr:hypothetical protein [Sphingopyxis sp.]HJS11087.1 hypothetical protein [Sphingopyxis sp.]